MIKGWLQDNGAWYYTDENGVMKTGLLELDGVRYLLDADGRMLVNTEAELDGVRHRIDGNGALSPAEAPPESAPQAGETTSADNGGNGAPTAGTASAPSSENGQLKPAGPGETASINAGQGPEAGNGSGISQTAPR